MSERSGLAVPIRVRTTQSGTALPNQDYQPIEQLVWLAARGDEAFAYVKVFSDTTPEPDETVIVEIVEVSYVSVADGTAVLTIADDD